MKPVRKLKVTDAVESFDCGQVALNQFLQRHALNNQHAHSAQTYVCKFPDGVRQPVTSSGRME